MDFEDFLFGFVVTAVLAVTVFGLFYLGMATEHNHIFNEWTQLCRNEGGSVEFWGTTRSGSQYECVKDNKVILHME